MTAMFTAAGDFEHDDVDATVIFVDMAGFTAFTEAHGDHRAAQLAEAFATLATRALGPGDELIKAIGDAVLTTSENTTAALAFLRRLHDETRGIDGFPLLRAGISAGPVVKRLGDVYGSTVNIAARLVDVAEAGQVVVDDVAASALRKADLIAARRLGPLALRNLGSPVEAFALDAGTRHRVHVDPICRMHVATDGSQLSTVHQGASYRFCSAACQRRFDQICQSWAPSFSV